MTEADEIDFQDGLTALAIVTGQVVTKPMRAAYWQFLRDLSIGDFKRAVGEAGRTIRFFPKPAELRELAGAGEKAAALAAWDAVRAANRKHGYTVGLDFGPLVNAVLRNMGGRRYLEDTPVSELDVWGKKEFERVYGLLATQDPLALNGAALAGAFGGAPVRIAIAGHAPSRQLEASSNVPAVVCALAESKAL